MQYIPFVGQVYFLRVSRKFKTNITYSQEAQFDLKMLLGKRHYFRGDKIS